MILKLNKQHEPLKTTSNSILNKMRKIELLTKNTADEELAGKENILVAGTDNVTLDRESEPGKTVIMVSSTPVDLSEYAKTTEVQTLVNGEATRAAGVEGELDDLTTDAHGNLVAAINEVDAHADTAQSTADNAQSTADNAASKADAAAQEVTSHTENADIHVTQADKENWNNKLDTLTYYEENTSEEFAAVSAPNLDIHSNVAVGDDNNYGNATYASCLLDNITNTSLRGILSTNDGITLELDAGEKTLESIAESINSKYEFCVKAVVNDTNDGIILTAKGHGSYYNDRVYTRGGCFGDGEVRQNSLSSDNFIESTNYTATLNGKNVKAGRRIPYMLNTGDALPLKDSCIYNIKANGKAIVLNKLVVEEYASIEIWLDKDDETTIIWPEWHWLDGTAATTGTDIKNVPPLFNTNARSIIVVRNDGLRTIARLCDWYNLPYND